MIQCFLYFDLRVAKPTKAPPVATGLNIVKFDLALLFTRDT